MTLKTAKYNTAHPTFYFIFFYILNNFLEFYRNDSNYVLWNIYSSLCNVRHFYSGFFNGTIIVSKNLWDLHHLFRLKQNVQLVITDIFPQGRVMNRSLI